MVSLWLYSLGSVALVSVLSLVGIFFLALKETTLQKTVFILVSLSVGALFGDVFIHIMPELFGGFQDPRAASFYVLGGIFFFFILEKFFRWHHVHTVEEDVCRAPEEVFRKHVGYMNLVSDGIHNFMDGIFIGVAYVISIPVGVATTIAVLLHELPQEIGDFGILLHTGFSKKNALLLNLLSASFAIIGVVVALLVGPRLEAFADIILALTAGTFVYVAGSDLVPELHRISDPAKSLVQLFSIALGIALMFLLLFVGA